MYNQSDEVSSFLIDISSMLLTTNSPQEDPPPTKSFSDEDFEKTSIVLYASIGLVSFFGIMSNIANIVVYVKQNVKESTTTISFTCLAVTDLGICLSTFAAFICYFINYENPKHFVNVDNVRRLCIYSRIGFSSMSMFTTVFLSVERCLCVIKPLTFKRIITKTRTVVVLTLLHIEVIVFYGLFFANMPFVWKHDGRYNMTRYTTITTEEYDVILNIHTYTNGFFVPLVLVGLVTISTIFMICGLWRASRFRNNASSCGTADGNGKASGISPKEVKLAKIVIYLLLIFIVTYFFVFGIDIVNKLRVKVEFNLLLTVWTVNHLIAAMNASANAVVYYNMSSRYKQIFKATFCNFIKTDDAKMVNESTCKYKH